MRDSICILITMMTGSVTTALPDYSFQIDRDVLYVFLIFFILLSNNKEYTTLSPY